MDEGGGNLKENSSFDKKNANFISRLSVSRYFVEKPKEGKKEFFI